ncbi:hypothetical protein [Algoriphagus sp.]|uniref:hypothetical protein n=1 Tax=Algoriphagus sp. TaxID=1872435 RepID=UPI0025E538F4|nr:hypothetical protein [Algoriphagus sp.]
MKTTKRISQIIGIVLCFLVTLPSCAPVFSDLQSARTLGKGQFEATPFYTNTGKDSEFKGVSHVGANLGLGLSEKIDVRARIERNWYNGEEDTGYTIVGIGPKFSVIENRISFFLPVGRALGEGTNQTWQMQPTVFLTQPIIKEKLEFTLAPKYLFNFCEDCSGNFATNFGISASKDFSKYAWRAEYGRIFSDGGGIGQLSIGISFVLGKKE